MTDSVIYIHEDDDGTVTLSTLPITTSGPVQEYETVEQAEIDEDLMVRVCRAHREYREILRHALRNAEHGLMVAELAEALQYLAGIWTDQINPAYERASREADRLDPDLNRNAPRRTTT